MGSTTLTRRSCFVVAALERRRRVCQEVDREWWQWWDSCPVVRTTWSRFLSRIDDETSTDDEGVRFRPNPLCAELYGDEVQSRAKRLSVYSDENKSDALNNFSVLCPELTK